MRRTKFSEWLMKKHWSSALFADRLAAELGKERFSTSTINNWRSGKVMPLNKTMRAIKRASDGELTADDFLPEER